MKEIDENTIQIDDEEKNNFFSVLGTEHLQMQSFVHNEFGKVKSDIYLKGIEFNYKIVTMIGVVAGFGFTAINFVDNIFLWVLGELLLFLSIFQGILWVQNIYNNEFKNLERVSLAYEEKFNKRNELFEKMYKQVIDSNGILIRDELKELMRLDESIKNDFIKKEKVSPRDLHPRNLNLLFILGCIVILSSFIVNELSVVIHFLKFC